MIYSSNHRQIKVPLPIITLFLRLTTSRCFSRSYSALHAQKKETLSKRVSPRSFRSEDSFLSRISRMLCFCREVEKKRHGSAVRNFEFKQPGSTTVKRTSWKVPKWSLLRLAIKRIIKAKIERALKWSSTSDHDNRKKIRVKALARRGEEESSSFCTHDRATRRDREKKRGRAPRSVLLLFTWTWTSQRSRLFSLVRLYFRVKLLPCHEYARFFHETLPLNVSPSCNIEDLLFTWLMLLK